MFFHSYDTAKRRLRQLKENNFLKCAIHPVLNKKIYYIKRITSYHSIIVNHIYRVQKEFKIDKYKVDVLLVLRDKTIVIIEVDIFNRTSKEKYLNIKKVMKSKKLEFKMLIVEKRKNKNSFCEEILIDDIEKIRTVV